MNKGFLFKPIGSSRPATPVASSYPLAMVRWERWATWLHRSLSLTIIVLGIVSGVAHNRWVVLGPAFGVGLVVIFLRYFIARTAGKADSLREAIAVFVGSPNSREAAGSRRLWYWECALWLLVIPAVILLNIKPWISLTALGVLGAGRYLIRRARQEWGGKPGRYGTVATITYVLLLASALAATVLRATGH